LTKTEPPNFDEFDKLLLETIEDVLSECLGDANAQIIYNFLEQRSCTLLEIPQKPDVFSRELRMLLGSGSSQILGSGAILEETILEVLSYKMGVTPNVKAPVRFADYVRKLKKLYGFARKLHKAEHGKKQQAMQGLTSQKETYLRFSKRR
jgi:hypothetical protein